MPVTRSSKRAPRLMIRSLFWSAATAATVPCMPGMPRCCGWLSGNAPRAISVVTTGMPVSSASSLELLRGARADGAAADVEHRAARLEHQPGRLADLLGVRAGHRAVAGQVQLGRPVERRHRLQRRLRDVDEHRAGAAGAGDVEGLGDPARDLVGVGDQEVVLGDRHRDAADVGLLEGVGADRGGADLAGDGDDRDRVHVRVRDRGDQVGGPGPDVAMHTPTRPVAAAKPCAAWPAPCSWRTRMCRILESISGSYAGRIAPPGMPKMSVTPAASSDVTRLCAPVICSLIRWWSSSSFLPPESAGKLGLSLATKNPSAALGNEG